MVAQKIRQGFYIGAECMNPQIRAFIKKFGDHVAHRHFTTLDRQTDRQANISSPHIIIPDAHETIQTDASNCRRRGMRKGGFKPKRTLAMYHAPKHFTEVRQACDHRKPA